MSSTGPRPSTDTSSTSKPLISEPSTSSSSSSISSVLKSLFKKSGGTAEQKKKLVPKSTTQGNFGGEFRIQ
ncbi:hypothetical protein P167DRAFT_540062 [Morchella conica CCBAS932]|uniref:Uncharacterized protein n=1 Tax=Morchella conica CCBAS932 TaxID=1392247 RepID=A0A3N4KAN7_9PEZI|nr:hypothetical protein P167DRAFT_540062 [Morchella conica CCBAS932]